MSSEFVDRCLERALISIGKLEKSGKKAVALEISSDVWLFINCGGINMFPGQKIFAGLKVIERDDLTDHVEAV